MVNKNVASPEMESLNEAMSKTELFFAENGRKVVYSLVALIAVAALLFGYKMVIVEPRTAEAAEAIASAQSVFESQNPDYAVALNGDEYGAGFLDIIENYGSTPSGNLANHYAGVCYLQLGDLAAAAKYLAAYDAVDGLPGAIINAQNLGLQGDIAVENGDYKGAVALFKKAAISSDNSFTSPLYLRKAAIAAIALGDSAAAGALLDEVIAKYPSSPEANEALKLKGSL